MISFQKLEGPYGIPVYYQRLPEMIKSVSFSWTIFVGSADDESIGAPGLYHWFEHVPFRGTKKYPTGSKEIKALCTKNGGRIGAYTNPHSTTYFTTVPIKIWREALSRITDLLSQPLLTESGINSEREIIVQEIADRKANSWGRVYYDLPEILWPGHAFGHHVLGNENTLRSMTPEILRSAHKANYDRSRCIFTAVGNIGDQELMSELHKICSDIPDHNLPERRVSTDYPSLPQWKKGAVTVRETQFDSSIVLMLFSLPENGDPTQNYYKWNILGDMFGFGSTESPLMRITREERSLVYHAKVFERYLPKGGYWGFAAETQTKNTDAVITAFNDTIKDRQVYSEARIEDVKTGLKGALDIRPIDTNSYRDQAISRIINAGTPFSDSDYLEALNKTTWEDIRNMIDSIKIEDAHTIVFRGKSS